MFGLNSKPITILALPIVFILKKFLVVYFLAFAFYLNVFSQWQFVTEPSTYVGNANYGYPDYMIFITEKHGYYRLRIFTTPSSGTAFRNYSTVDSGYTWTMTNSWFTYAPKYQVHHIPHTNSWYNFVKYNIEPVYKSIVDDPNPIGFYPVGVGIIDLNTSDSSYFYVIHNYGFSMSGTFYISRYHNDSIYQAVDTFTQIVPVFIRSPDVSTVFLAASYTLYAQPSIIFKSVSSGTNWQKVFDDSTITLTDMDFVNQNTGYVSGFDGLIVKTIDGGTNWQTLQTNTTLNINSIDCLNDSVCYAAGDSGLIMTTVNGGSTWHSQRIHNGNFDKIRFINDSVCFAYSGVAVYKTKHKNIVSSHFPEDKKLVIFPNPGQNIAFAELPIEFINYNKVTLEIYNCIGQEVHSATIIPEDRISIPIEHLPGGAYHVKLSNGRINYIGKIVILN